MTTTPRLGAPYLEQGETVPETAVNEAVTILEAFATSGVVLDRDLATPPTSPAQSDCYLVAASPTGAWTGKAGYVACFINTAWGFVAPFEGLTLWVADEDGYIAYDGSVWAALGLTLDDDETLAGDSSAAAPTQHAVKAYVDAAVAASGAMALPLSFNFTAAGDAYFYADVAMTLTEQASTGAGTVSYEKGTTAAPDTFTATTSPITLQAGAWLKVSSDDALAVHLKRTA